MCGSEVLLDDRGNIARGEGMQVEFRSDWHAVQFQSPNPQAPSPKSQDLFTYSATTVVVMPPRAVKAPVTDIRRGWHTATRSSRIRLVTAS